MLKKLLAASTLAAGLLIGAATAQDQHGQHGHAGKKEGRHHRKATPDDTANVNLKEGEVVKRGAALAADAKAVALADVLKEPKSYAGKEVVVEGVVERVCQKQGCWMELAPERGARGVRVASKDHSFFVPFNSAGLRARAAGVFEVKHLSEDEAAHMEKEGAHVRRDKDGEASEVTLLATGVELRK